MVYFLVLCHSYVCQTLNTDFFERYLIDFVSFCLGFQHLLVEPQSINDNIFLLVSVKVKLLLVLGELEAEVVKPTPK